MNTEDAVFKLPLSGIRKKKHKKIKNKTKQKHNQPKPAARVLAFFVWWSLVSSFTTLRLIYKMEKTIKLTESLLAYERIHLNPLIKVHWALNNWVLSCFHLLRDGQKKFGSLPDSSEKLGSPEWLGQLSIRLFVFGAGHA